jgi:hypothetical protein
MLVFVEMQLEKRSASFNLIRWEPTKKQPIVRSHHPKISSGRPKTCHGKLQTSRRINPKKEFFGNLRLLSGSF